MAQKNPYATTDNGPQDGQYDNWIRWEQDRETERRAALTQEQRDAEDAAYRQIRRRRQSELA